MKPAASEQKLRGGYYTPPTIAQFLANWAITTPEDTVLEPSAGDGAFVSAAVARLGSLGASNHAMTAVELDRREAAKVRSLLEADGGTIHSGDFFAWAQRALSRRKRYQAILGNPPFLRFQHFRAEHRDVAFQLMRDQGLHPNKLTNAWVPFVAISAALLAPGGRLGMVLPAELLQVSYAAELRRFLAEYFRRVTVFAFDRLVFEGIQQEVVLVTAERGDSGPSGIRMVELEDAHALARHQHDWSTAPLKSLNHDTEKWTQYFLSEDELEVVREVRASGKLTVLGEVAEVDVGVVTGMNDFFVLDANGSTPPALKARSVPVITRSNQLVGGELTDADWDALYKLGEARLLLALDNDDVPDEVLAAYLAIGTERGIHNGYKCSIRRQWYVVPSRWRPSGFMLRQIHGYPKLAINRTQATSTDTVHRVAFRNERQAEAVVAGFHNSATFLFAEIFGRSYGGGVLELEPTEAEKLLIAPATNSGFGSVDRALRLNDVNAVVSLGDKVLAKSAGLSPDDLRLLRSGWQRLRDRRLRRNRGPRRPAGVGVPA